MTDEEQDFNLVYCAIIGFIIILFLMYFDLIVTTN